MIQDDKVRVPDAAIPAGLAAAALAAAQYYIWVHAPVEATMGLLQKIFYIHLPCAWWGMLSFFLVFASGIGYLTRRTRIWDAYAAAAAELGVLFSGLALITGSLWGRAAWNTWWTWDPRLTTTLVMWFVYAAYLVLRGSQPDFEKRAKLSAVLGIVAFLDVPLVFVSARLWRSIHPAVFASKGGGLEPEMVTAVVVSVLAIGLLWLSMLLIRVRQLTHSARLDTLIAATREE